MPLRYTERIPLEMYAFLEIEADTFQELQAKVLEAKTVYASRIFREKESAPFVDKPGDTTCDKCKTPMNLQTRKNKKGEMFTAYFCPNGSAQDPHPLKYPPKQYYGPNA